MVAGMSLPCSVEFKSSSGSWRSRVFERVIACMIGGVVLTGCPGATTSGSLRPDGSFRHAGGSNSTRGGSSALSGGVPDFGGSLDALDPGSAVCEPKNPTRGVDAEFGPSTFERLNPFSSRPSASAQKLTQIAYDGTKVHRNSSRSVTGNKASNDSIGRCAMYVSIALHAAGCHESGKPEIRENSAKNLGPDLQANGFRNLLSGGRLPSGAGSLHDLPPGAVLVYSNGGHGHVEIKSSKGFISDYFSNLPVTGSRGPVSGRGYRLVGAWVKPSCGAGS